MFRRFAAVESSVVVSSVPTGPVKATQKLATLEQSGFTFPAGYPRPGYLYTVVRAISARVNRNFDGFPASQLKEAYKTFEGRPVFVNHANEDHKKTRGVILAANWHEEGIDKYISLLNEVDAVKFPELSREIETGGLDAVSMGTDVERSICSYCENVATEPEELCSHVIHKKGSILKKNGEDCLVYEELYGLSFFEISYVFDPADETAVMREVIKVSSTSANEALPVSPEAQTISKTLTEVTAWGNKNKTPDFGQLGFQHGQQGQSPLQPGTHFGEGSAEHQAYQTGFNLGQGQKAMMPAFAKSIDQHRGDATAKLAFSVGQQVTVTTKDGPIPGTVVADQNLGGVTVQLQGGTTTTYDPSQVQGGVQNNNVAPTLVQPAGPTMAAIKAQVGKPYVFAGNDPTKRSLGDVYNSVQGSCPWCTTNSKDVGEFAGHLQSHRGEMTKDERFTLDQHLRATSGFDCSKLTKWAYDEIMQKHALGEQKAPKQVDTLRPAGPCPQCNSDEYDGSNCDLCDFSAPIPGLDDPDTEMAQQVDLRQKEQESQVQEDQLDPNKLPAFDHNQGPTAGHQLFVEDQRREGSMPSQKTRPSVAQKNLAEARKRLSRDQAGGNQNWDNLLDNNHTERRDGVGMETFETILFDQPSAQAPPKSTDQTRNEGETTSVDTPGGDGIPKPKDIQDINVMSLPSNRASRRTAGGQAGTTACPNCNGQFDYDQYGEGECLDCGHSVDNDTIDHEHGGYSPFNNVPTGMREEYDGLGENVDDSEWPESYPNAGQKSDRFNFERGIQSSKKQSIRFDDGSKICDNCAENTDRLFVNPDQDGDPSMSLCANCYDALEKFAGDEKTQDALQRVKIYLDKTEGNDPAAQDPNADGTPANPDAPLADAAGVEGVPGGQPMAPDPSLQPSKPRPVAANRRRVANDGGADSYWSLADEHNDGNQYNEGDWDPRAVQEAKGYAQQNNHPYPPPAGYYDHGYSKGLLPQQRQSNRTQSSSRNDRRNPQGSDMKRRAGAPMNTGIRRRSDDVTKYDTADHVDVETPVSGSDSADARTEQWSRDKYDKNGPVADQPLGGDGKPLNADMLPRSSRVAPRASAVQAIRLVEAYIAQGLVEPADKYSKVAEFERMPAAIVEDRINLLERVGSAQGTGVTQSRPRRAVPTSRTASSRLQGPPALGRRSSTVQRTSGTNLDEFPDSAAFV